jgi:hypothetical protein
MWVAVAVGALILFAVGRSGCGMGHNEREHRRKNDADYSNNPGS